MAVEQARGCGFRRVGNLYLVGAGLATSCDRLPLELTCCKACGNGLKFTRQPAKINPLQLWGLHAPVLECACFHNPLMNMMGFCTCPVCSPEPETAYLLGVGENNYPMPEDFVKEAITMGVSKRIARIPRELKLGETWIYLVHRKAVVTGIRSDGNSDYGAGVFYAFRPQRVEKLVWESEMASQAEELKKRGIMPVAIPDGDKDHMPVKRKRKGGEEETEIVNEEQEPLATSLV